MAHDRSAPASRSASAHQGRTAGIEDFLYDPWRQAYKPRRFEIVRSMMFGDGPAVVVEVNHRRQEALLMPLKEMEWIEEYSRSWQPFSMIRKFYDRDGHRKPKRPAG